METTHKATKTAFGYNYRGVSILKTDKGFSFCIQTTSTNIHPTGTLKSTRLTIDALISKEYIVKSGMVWNPQFPFAK